MVARLGTSLAIALMVLLLAMAGIGLLVAALWLWLATLLPAPAAALVGGVTVLAIAGLVMVIGRLALRDRPSARIAPAAPLIGGASPSVAAAIGSELGAAGSAWMKGHAPQVLLGAAAAGFLLGVSPRLRAALLRLMR
jgi:hypothetical protein